MKTTPKLNRKPARKKILVPLLGMSLAVSSYSTSGMEPAASAATPTMAAVEAGTGATARAPEFCYVYYWYGYPYFYCYYWYPSPIFFYYYYYW